MFVYLKALFSKINPSDTDSIYMGLSKELNELPLDCKKDEYWKHVHEKWFVVDENDHQQLRRPGLLKKEYEFRNGSMISLSPKVSV